MICKQKWHITGKSEFSEKEEKVATCLHLKIFIENFIAFYMHCSTSVSLQNLPHYNK